MNELQLFIFKNQQVRTLVVNSEPLFAGNDVARILGYSDLDKAIRQHVEEEDKETLMYKASAKTFPSLWQGNDFSHKTMINESGLYSLIFSSKLPDAKKFKRWVTSEVLPSIRQNGAYLTDQKAYDITHNPNSLADLLLQAGEQLKQKELIIKTLEPKALFADSVSASRTSILVSELAKLIRQNGIKIGANRLFSWLRENGYLIKRKGNEWNMPTQRSMEMDLFEIKETVVWHADGHTTINKTPKVTGKGQVYFVNKFLNEKVS